MLVNRLCVVSLLFISPVAFADSLNINLNNNAAQFQFNSSASDFIEGNSELHAGVLYNDTNNIFIDAGLMVRGGGEEEGAPGLSVGVGVKGVFGTIQPQPGIVGASASTVSGVGVGGEVTFVLPTTTRVAFVAEYFASPKIMSFADAQRFNQFGVRVEAEVSPQARVYVGYREIGFGVRNTVAGASGSLMLDSGTHLGVIVSF
jgi:hypothetical protein